uniref:SR-related CTD associated factor 1 transcript variant 13 n=1 Tax=Homo sapiens TaxID=9606 RepID=A0A2U8BR36_HUMAN|nr:SR-related CTD associated factor 1 transcript variant 13 [Homo sapiens]
MEEEDESRGKTEESGEDRGDGPPDRDPTLSPSAFILMALGVMAFDGGAAGVHGQSPVPRNQGALTRLLSEDMLELVAEVRIGDRDPIPLPVPSLLPRLRAWRTGKTVSEEAAHAGAGGGGGEAGHQAILSEEGHHQGGVQGHPEEGRPQDLPQQKWGNQPSEGEQPGAGLRPALPLLPQARSQARGPPRAPTAAQGARAPRQGWPGPAPAPSLRALASSSPLTSLKLWTYLWLHLPTSLPRQWDDWGRVAAGKRRAPCPALPRVHLPCPQACPQCPSLLFVPLSPISLKIS